MFWSSPALLNSTRSFSDFMISLRNAPVFRISTEHAKTRFTGGIGTYTQELAKVLPEPSLILFIGRMGLDENNARILREER